MDKIWADILAEDLISTFPRKSKKNPSKIQNTLTYISFVILLGLNTNLDTSIKTGGGEKKGDAGGKTKTKRVPQVVKLVAWVAV